MTIHTLPAIWDAKKFATRYSLDLNKDFYVDSNGMLVVFPALPDNPPIFDAPDPPGPSLTSRIAALPATVNTELKSILTELARGR